MEKLNSSQIKAFSEAAEKFARKEITSKLKLEAVEPPGFPWEIVRAGGAAGYLTGPLDEEKGGIGLDTFAQAVILEKLASAAAGPATVIAVHNAVLSMLAKHPGSTAARKWLDNLAASVENEKPPLAALAVPETAVDLDRPVLPVVKSEGDSQLVTGDFLCIFDPTYADKVLIAIPGTKKGPRYSTALAVFVDAENLEPHRRNAYPGSGLEECPVVRLRLDDFPAPKDSIVYEGDCRELTNTVCSLLSAVMAGTSMEAARAAREYANQRVQTGRLIIEHQEVEKTLAKMDLDVEAMRSYLYAAIEGGEGRIADPVRAYLFCGDAAESVCQWAVQTFGGYGYMKDYGIEKRLRDVKSLQVLLGSYTEDWFE